MAEHQDAQREVDTSEDATAFEVTLYVIGILLIPLVPIFMVAVFTPFSGISN